ncbi:DUF2478 domain-containing protein [Thalassobius sp. S69A]|uniref:DUF2478 domain-containing protein n=1 Tax=unclassified Thalassovita TaxID=2619711 RepID=UPI000C0DA651|nr:3-dehydroquinate dehydratase [Paracoccaceae bacterium]MBT26790.1 3-dehydroquinate dehydratase [Paracoccaceae bacterium]
MLGFVISETPGQAETLLRQVAQALCASGVAVTGATQRTDRDTKDARQKMVLSVLPAGPDITISQDLGALATGCSLDPDGLEQAAGLIAASLDHAPQILLLNKFGKQEAEGAGFRAVIGQALAQDIPVLIGVGREKLPLFQEFAGDLAEELQKDEATLLRWCQAHISAG